MTRAVPQHWLLFAGPSDTGLAVQLEPVMSKNGISLSFTPGPIGERLDIELKTGENDNIVQTDAYRALEDSARNGGGSGYALLQSEDHLRCEATFRFQFEEKHLNSDVLHNVSGASADLLFGLAVITAVRSDLEYRPFAATGILTEDGQVQPIEGLHAKIHAALNIPALSGNGLIFYPKANDKDIDAELRYKVEQAQIDLKPVERLEEAVECLGIPIQGTWSGNPYRRLDVFEYSHRRIYFGRENEADHLAKKLFERSKLGRPNLLILGPSGGGKSSLVQAGLIPELEKRFKDHALSPLFSVFDLRSAANKDADAIATSIRSSWSLLPGLAALAVNNSLGQNANITPLNTFSALVSDLIRCLPEQTIFVWVLDQLEQFFTLGLSEEADAAFIHFLRELQASGIWIVATFRNDFYSALRAHDGILSIFDKDGTHDLEKFSETTIERIIQKPAKLAKLEFEYDDRKSELLSLKLKNDALEGGKDILPLLEFALDQLYQKRELKNGRTQLTWAAYEAMGGLQGAIGNRADEVLHSLDVSAQEALGRVLRAIAKLRRDSVQTEGGKNPFIASIVDVEQFPSGTPARRLVDAFADARLFVRDRDNKGIAQVRVTHEALFTHWAKADEILRDSMKDMVVRERLADSEAHWKAKNEAMSLLLQPGLPLEEAQDLLARLGDELDPDIIHYINQSGIADQEQKQQESKSQRRKTRFAVITAVVLGILLVVAAGAIYYVNEARNEQAQMLASSYFSEGARLVDEERSNEALAYLAQAMRLNSNHDTAAARLTASILFSSRHHNISTVRIQCPDNRMNIAQFSSDGRFILSVCGLFSAQIWDTVSGKPLFNPLVHQSVVRLAEFSPDGLRVVTASDDYSVQIWEATTGALVFPPMHHKDNVNSVQFSADGRWLVTASRDRTAQVWDAVTGKPVSKPMQHKDSVRSAQFSPDGRWVVTTSGDTAQVWEANTGTALSQPIFNSYSSRGESHRAEIFSAYFSPNGRWVVTASQFGMAQVWNAATGEFISMLQGKGWDVESAQFSPDGRLVVTAYGDTVQVWEAATGVPVSQPMQHENFVNSAEFSPDGRWLVTASGDRTVRVWEATTGVPVSSPMQHKDRVKSAQFSPDGRRVLTSSSNNTAQLWEASVMKPLLGLMEFGKSLFSDHYIPKGRLVVINSNDNTAQVWDTVTGKMVSQLINHRGRANLAKLSLDGHWVVTAYRDTVQVWKAATGEPVLQMTHLGNVNSAEFSSDGRRVVTASENEIAQVYNVQVWEAASGVPISKPMQHKDYVNSAKFSPDGRWVVTTSDDKTAQVWDATTGDPISKPMQHEDSVDSIQFSPDGSLLVTALWSGKVQVWQTVTGEPVAKLIQHKDKVKSAQFSPDGRWVVTASNDKTAQVWDAATSEPISKSMEHEGAVWSAHFSPDGRWVVTASLDKTIRVWEAVTGKPASVPFKHQKDAYSALFSPNGSHILTMPTYANTWGNDRPYTISTWEIPKLPKIGNRFIEFLELVCGYSLNNNVLQEKYKDSTIRESRDWVTNTVNLSQEERSFINWWLSDPIERTVTPDSKQTVKERVQMLIEHDNIMSLNEALDYYPGHPMALARLAAATWREAKSDQQNDIRPRVSLWANLALKYAPGDTDVRAVAEKVLLDIAQPN